MSTPYRDIKGGKLKSDIPLLRRVAKSPEKARAALQAAIAKSQDSWSHPQVALHDLDLEGLGFKPTRLAIPLPGERIGTTSWRSGELHAHRQGPVYLVHQDASSPGSIQGVLHHALHDVPPAIVKRLKMHEPFAKAANTRGVYKGQPSAPDTVKFKVDFQGLPVQVERPRGFLMLGVDEKGKHWVRRYRYDYGHIPKTLGGDNDGLDVFLGPKKKSEHAFWAIQRKPDGSFDEYKVFLGFDNRDEAIAAYRAHIPKRLFAGMMTMRVDMMHAMLGKNPERQLKTSSATYVGMLREIMKLSAVKTQLQGHQQRVVDRIQREDQPGLVVVHGLGSGKTLTSIAAQEALGLPSQVVAPASLLGNYEKERRKHLTDSTQDAELLSMQNMSVKGLKPNAPLLIVDEAHRARDPSTATFQMLKGNTSDKRLLMTGSPFYNHPVDLAGLVDIAADAPILPYDKKEFERRYVSEEKQKLPFMQKVMNLARSHEDKLKPGMVPKLYAKNAPELQAAYEKWVDFHPGSTENFPEVTREDVKVPMTKAQLRVYDTLMDKAPAWVALKVRRGLPPSKAEAAQLNSFLSGARQAVNTTAPFIPAGTPAEETKIDAAFKNLQSTLGSNDRAKAVVYSNFLDAGITPYKKRLIEAGIPFGEFTGDMPMKQRNQLVQDYNEGKLRTLLLSSAGGEGLDLKGTRLLQVLEPHWNDEKLKQVEGRGARYMSHVHLPPEERNLLVQRYLSTRPEGKAKELMRMWLKRKPDESVDQYLAQRSKEKEDLISQFRGLLPNQKTAASRYKETDATKELRNSTKFRLASHAVSTMPLSLLGAGGGATLGGLLDAQELVSSKLGPVGRYMASKGIGRGALLGAGAGAVALLPLGLLVEGFERQDTFDQGKALARAALAKPSIENELRENAGKMDWNTIAGHGLSLSGPTALTAAYNYAQNKDPVMAGKLMGTGLIASVPLAIGAGYKDKYKRLIALNELDNMRRLKPQQDLERLERLKRKVTTLEDTIQGGWNRPKDDDDSEYGAYDLTQEDLDADAKQKEKMRKTDRSGKAW